MILCHDGSPCLMDSTECYAPFAGMCSRKDLPNVANLIRKQTARRGKVGPPPETIAEYLARVGVLARVGQTDLQFAPGSTAQIWPAAFSGGAERAMISLIRATQSEVRWRGVGILSTHINSPEILDELRSLVPVAIGPDQVRRLISGSQTLVTWAIPDIADMLPISGPKPKVISISHSPSNSPWAVETLAKTRGVDQWVAVSRDAIGPIPDYGRASAIVIPNAIDFDRLVPVESMESVRASWGIPANAKVLGCLHRQSSEKDPTALARTVSFLPDNWFGVSIGDGIELQSTKDHADEVAHGRVKILPGRQDIGSVLGGFDAILISSLYESFCLSMAEAFGFGVPVVSTPVGIAKDWPSLVRPIPINDYGQQSAAAILKDTFDPYGTLRRVGTARRLARRLWTPQRLGESWSKLLVPDRLSVAESRRRIKLVNACPDRGCRKSCQTSDCRKLDRVVSLLECLECVSNKD